jgi:DNA-binding protein H-NS
MADINQILDDIKKQVGPLAEQDLQEFAAQGKQDAQAYLDESKAKLATWVEQLKNGEIDEDDLRSLLESQTVIGEMRALRAANAGTIRIERFRDSFFKAVVSTAVTAIASKGTST